jgi:hypothetical protein
LNNFVNGNGLSKNSFSFFWINTIYKVGFFHPKSDFFIFIFSLLNYIMSFVLNPRENLIR